MMKRYFRTLGIYALISVITLSAAALYFLVRADKVKRLGADDDFVRTKTVVICRDGESFADFEIGEKERRALYISAASEGEVVISGESYKAKIVKAPSGDTIITLSPRLSIYRTVIVMLIAAEAIFTAFFVAAMHFSLKRTEREIISPVKGLSQSLKSVADGDYDICISDEGIGEIKTLCETAEDLRLRLKDEVLKAEKAEDDRKFLISSVSHDLKTPVAAVRGYLEGIRDHVADTKEKREKYIKSAIERLDTVKTMIDDLMLYSRLDSEKGEYDIITVELTEYLSDFAAEEEALFSSEGKKLFFHGCTERVSADIDPEKFGRAIRNITQNAKKYIESGTGRVDIFLRKVRSNAVIEIRDNGIGLEPHELQKIFDRFYRASEARTSDGSVGLGLAICKRIVEDLGGKLWATSKKGEGTAFMISLAAKASEERK